MRVGEAHRGRDTLPLNQPCVDGGATRSRNCCVDRDRHPFDAPGGGWRFRCVQCQGDAASDGGADTPGGRQRAPEVNQCSFCCGPRPIGSAGRAFTVVSASSASEDVSDIAQVEADDATLGEEFRCHRNGARHRGQRRIVQKGRGRCGCHGARERQARQRHG